MDGLRHVRVNGNQVLVQLSMLLDHDLRVKGRRDKDSVDTAADGCGEDLADLQTNQEGIGHDDRGKVAVGVVAWLSEDQVQVSEKGAGIADEGSAHCQYRTNQAFVDESVDTAVFDQAGEG